MKSKFINKITILLTANIALLGVIIAGTSSVNRISGNGNPMIIFVFILIPLAAWLGFEWIRWISYFFTNHRALKIAIPILSVFVLIAGAYWTSLAFGKFEQQAMKSALDKFGDTQEYNNFVNYVTYGLNIYTNSLYFNYITFLMYISLLNLAGTVVGYIRKK